MYRKPPPLTFARRATAHQGLSRVPSHDHASGG